MLINISSGKNFLLLICFATSVFAKMCVAQCDPEIEFCGPPPPPPPIGDFNFDGIIYHADYTVLSENLELFGGFNAYHEYSNNFGCVAGEACEVNTPRVMLTQGTTVSPFTISVGRTADGDQHWTLFFRNVVDGPFLDGALSASVNIVSDRTLLSAFDGGPHLQAVPGFDIDPFPHVIGELGVLKEITVLYAGLGTNLGEKFTGTSLRFLTFTTEGQQPTTIEIEGAFGYKGRDYLIRQTATAGSVEPGSSPSNPILPTPDNPSQFFFPNVPSGSWFDPPAVNAFEYVMESGSLFTAIREFPPGFDNPFQVTAEDTVLGTFSPGQSVDFVEILGHGVDRFIVSDISPVVDAEDPLAFPLRITFNTPFASFSMSPFSESPPAEKTLSELIAELSFSVGEIPLTGGLTNALQQQLANILASVEAPNSTQRQDAIHKLDAFMNLVEAQRDKKIPALNAMAFLASAEAIKTRMTFSTVASRSSVPEPSTFFLLAISAISLLGYRKARSHG